MIVNPIPGQEERNSDHLSKRRGDTLQQPSCAIQSGPALDDTSASRGCKPRARRPGALTQRETLDKLLLTGTHTEFFNCLSCGGVCVPEHRRRLRAMPRAGESIVAIGTVFGNAPFVLIIIDELEGPFL